VYAEFYSIWFGGNGFDRAMLINMVGFEIDNNIAF
jgi:hypothetical protein